jgi:hypothetical protein
MIGRLFCALPLLLLPTLALAEDYGIKVSDCDCKAGADNIVEPWAENTRTFAQGNVRLALLDTIEPALGWAHLLVLSPPYNEVGGRQCKVVGVETYGFAGMLFDQLTSRYDPATGLTFTVPVQTYVDGVEDFAWLTLSVTLNQATGAITTDLILP